MRTSLQPLTVVGHLEELRKRIIVCLVIFLAVFLALVTLPSFTDSFGTRIMNFLREFFLKDLVKGAALKLVFLDPLEPVFTVLKLSLLTSLFILSPVFFYQAWAYIGPAFKKKTKKYMLLLFFGAFFFLFLGAVFSFYLLMPISFKILIQYGLSAGAEPVLSMGKFFDMFIVMLVLFAIPFELPVVIGVLSKAGIVSARALAKARKIMYFGMAVFAAAVTPDPTPVSMLILWAMLVLLFEFGIFLARLFERSKK